MVEYLVSVCLVPPSMVVCLSILPLRLEVLSFSILSALPRLVLLVFVIFVRLFRDADMVAGGLLPCCTQVIGEIRYLWSAFHTREKGSRVISRHAQDTP